MRKNQSWVFFFCLSRFGNYQRFQSLFQAESKKKKKPKSGNSPAAIPTSQPSFGRQPIPKERKNEKRRIQPNHREPERGIFALFSSWNFQEFGDLLPEFPAGRGAGKRSSHELGSLNAGWGWNSSVHAPKFRNSGAFPAKSSASVAKAERGGVAESFYF